MGPARAPDTVVLIHGLHLTPLAWQGWVHRYTTAGYRVLAPAWPGMDRGVEALRHDPSPIAAQTVPAIVEHHARIVAELDRPPIIIGHCYGGAVAQLLLDRGLGAAGVALGSTPPKGVGPLPWSTVRAGAPIVRDPRNRNRAVPLTPRQFHRSFANAFSEDEALAVYQRHTVPAPGRVVFSRALADLVPRSPYTVHFGRAGRAPLLFVAGGADRVAPPALVRATARRYQRAGAAADYLELPGHCHFTLGQDGWPEVADRVLAWAEAAAAPR